MDKLIFWSLLILSLGFFSSEIYYRYRTARLGKPHDRGDNSRSRWIILFKHVFMLNKINMYPCVGLLHGFIMWGFIILFLSTLDMAGSELFDSDITLIRNSSLYLVLRDLFLVLVLVGVIGFIIRRLFFKPDWLHNSFKAYGILLLILIIIGSEIIYYASLAVFEAGTLPQVAWLVSSIAELIAGINNQAIELLKLLSWWIHFLSIFLFLYITPRTKHLHLIFAPLNIYLSSPLPRGSIARIDLNQHAEQVYGVRTLRDFTWKQLLDAFSCVQCGRCHGFCPSERSGERLKPKKISGRLRTEMELVGRKLLKFQSEQTRAHPGRKMIADQPIALKNIVGDMFHHDFIWSCTTCGACNEVCPVAIDNLNKIIAMRKNIVSEHISTSSPMQQVFQGIEKFGNSWGKDRLSTNLTNWFKDLGIRTLGQNPDAEYLFYVGCQAAFDDSARNTVMAMARIMHQAGVNFAVLGDKEWCCGEIARRMGNELLFQKTVKNNISSWRELRIKKIITACPHCFNTLQNEYVHFGGNYQVIPHVVFLAELQNKGKLKISRNQSSRITYHDPCYLGRYNAVYNEQRKLITSIPGVDLVEMPRSREESFCCGAGGGRFWMRHRGENPISVNRVKQALATDADIIVTSCPYCNKVFNEKIKDVSQEDVNTLDIAELIESSL